MECFRCDQDAVQECPRCGALYCDEHGEALCERCMDPELALPSYRIYRGSLLALLAGTVFAVWLLVRPTPMSDADGPVPAALAGVISTATATATATTTPAATATPTAMPTAMPTATPEATATVTSEPAAGSEYTVTESDTLFSIAVEYLPPGTNVLTFMETLASFNELEDAHAIVIGQVIQIPPQ